MKTEVKPRWTVDRQYANQCVGIDPDGRNWQIYIVNERNEAVARVQGATKEECEANAHRILNPQAELLAALRVVMDAVDYTAPNCSQRQPVGEVLDRRIIGIARAAIAKATGE